MIELSPARHLRGSQLDVLVIMASALIVERRIVLQPPLRHLLETPAVIALIVLPSVILHTRDVMAVLHLPPA